MKKILSVILTLSIILLSLPLSVVTASAATSGYYTYTISNGEATITGVDSSISGSVTIPSTLGGYKVTSIGNYAFSDCYSLTSITIPDSVTSIGNYAFRYCSSLEVVNFNAINCASMGTYYYPVFSNCTNLKTVNIGEKVTNIPTYAFYNCTSLTKVNITDIVAWCNIYFAGFYSNPLYYAENLYLNNELVTNLVIPDTVTQIKQYAFRYCTSLTSVTIPDSVTSIGSSAFYSCDSLTSITIPDSVTSIGSSAFSYCSSLTSVTIPDSVTSIGSSAFSSCSSLTSVTIPDSVTSIGNFAFSSCDSLTSITIPDSVTSIGDYAFYYCISLTSIEVSENNKNYFSVDGVLFNKDKTELICYPAGKTNKDYTIPDSITSIGDSAFEYCRSLTSITIPDSVTSIGYSAFDDCTSLTSVTIPDSVTSIGSSAFYDCDSLKKVYYLGSKTDKNNIKIGTDNSKLTNATWYYNSCIGRSEHSYTLNGNNTCNVCKYSKMPEAPKPTEITSTSIILEKIEGFEYSIDGVNWQDSNVFDNLTPNKEYTFYQRVKASDISKVSEKGNGLNVTTPKYTNTIIPSAPLLEAKTDKTVTLLKTEGYEYSKDGSTWQSSNVFNNLSPNTEYTFYQRIAQTENTYASEKSEGLIVKTYIENTNIPSKPTVLMFDDSSVTLKKVTGVEYSIDGENWQEGNVFNGLLPNTEYSFYQRYAQNGDIYHSVTSAVLLVTTDRILQTEIPSAPTVESVTADKIILNQVDGCEYSKDGYTWQSSNIFDGLEPSTEYTFYQRYAQNDTHYAGKKSSALTVKTEKGAAKTPNAPTLESKSYNRITLHYVAGYEYSMDGENWQKSNVFTGLNAFTNYAFFCRVAETDKNYASDCSDSLIVKTDVMPEFILGDCNGDFNVDTTDLATMKLFLAGLNQLTGSAELGADLNQDGNIDTTDLASLKLKLAGL